MSQSSYLHGMMKRREFQVSDGHTIVAHSSIYDGAELLVHVCHGMAEHGLRYTRFAERCHEAGISLVVNDHRGHGKTSELNGHRGFFAEKNGWDRATKDVCETHLVLRKEFPNTKTVLFGHSMGAILATCAAIDLNEECDGLVLSALAHHPGILLPIGKALSYSLSAIFGPKKESAIMNLLTFADFNKAFKPNRTAFDWLSRDQKEVDLYINDPDCGQRFTHRFFYDLLCGLERVHKEVHRLHPSLPLMMMAGEMDPVVGFKKEALKTMESVASGRSNVNQKIYDHARHELLNELNKDAVMDDVIAWLLEQTNSKK